MIAINQLLINLYGIIVQGAPTTAPNSHEDNLLVNYALLAYVLRYRGNINSVLYFSHGHSASLLCWRSI